MDRRRLPIGIQDFRTIREDDFYYVDKTALVHRLVEDGRHYFLARPRRFGKSLLLDTLRELFECNEPLFRGLDIHGLWDWAESHPVLHLSFGGKYNEPGDLAADIRAQLSIIGRNADLEPAPEDLAGPGHLRALLDGLHRSSGAGVVVLVDEYDKPILDALDKPELARANRDYLRGFYGIIKDSARLVRFVFVTGVSMFSKVSLFSGLNNLEDISLDPRFSAICGYTDRELDTVFAPEIAGLDRGEIRAWYNGYHFLGMERVYNPFDVLLLFRRRRFRPWWFETGSPEFLFQVMMEQGVSSLDLENRVAEEDLLSTFDVGNVGVDALLFQTGYLTIVEEERRDERILYRLDYPNKEVRLSLNNSLLQHVTGRGRETREQGKDLCRLLAENEFDAFADRLRSFFAGIPYQWRIKDGLARYEAWYAGMLYACFRTIGVELRAEESSSGGRADMVLLHDGQVFVLEFKMAEDGEAAESAVARAMRQMRERGSAGQYRDRGEPIHLVGVVFGRSERNLLAVRAEREFA